MQLLLTQIRKAIVMHLLYLTVIHPISIQLLCHAAMFNRHILHSGIPGLHLSYLAISIILGEIIQTNCENQESINCSSPYFALTAYTNIAICVPTYISTSNSVASKTPGIIQRSITKQTNFYQNEDNKSYENIFNVLDCVTKLSLISISNRQFSYL